MISWEDDLYHFAHYTESGRNDYVIEISQSLDVPIVRDYYRWVSMKDRTEKEKLLYHTTICETIISDSRCIGQYTIFHRNDIDKNYDYFTNVVSWEKVVDHIVNYKKCVVPSSILLSKMSMMMYNVPFYDLCDIDKKKFFLQIIAYHYKYKKKKKEKMWDWLYRFYHDDNYNDKKNNNNKKFIRDMLSKMK